MFVPLLHNITLLITLGILYGLVIRNWKKGSLAYSVSTGILFSVFTIIGMKTAVVLAPGLIFDGRSIIISIGSFLGGPLTAAITVVVSSAYRLWIGGPGALMGVCVIAESALIGLACFYLDQKYHWMRNHLSLLMFGLAVHVVMLLLMFLLPGGLQEQVFAHVAIPVIVIYPIATVVLGLFFFSQEERVSAKKQVEESERQYRQLVETANSVILKWRLSDGTITYMNSFGLEFFGYSAEELLGKSVVGTIVPETEESTGRDLREMIASMADAPEEYASNVNENIRKDGSRVWLRWRNQVLNNKDGEVDEMLSMGVDITEQRKSEIALKASETILRERNIFIETILDNLPIGLGVNDTRDNKTLYMNTTFEEIYGWPRSLMKSVEAFFEHVYPDPAYRREIIERVMGDINSGDPKRMVWRNIRIMTSDGETRYVVARNIPLPEQNMMISTVQDNTDSKLAEDSLRHQSELLESILDNIPIVVGFVDIDGQFRWVNKTWTKVLGYSLEEMQSLRDFSVFYPDPDELRRVMESIERAEGIWGDFRTRAKSGKILDMQWMNIRLSDNTNIGIGIDLTDKLKSEKKQRELEEQLIQSQKMEAIGRLAGGVAHDFNNMLVVIMGNAQLALARLNSEDPLYNDLKEISRAAERSSELTRQMLAFSRRQIASPAVISLNKLVLDREPMLSRMLGEEIEIILDLDDSLWNVRIDPSQFEQVLMNLSVNARDAIRDSGTITIETANNTIDEEYSDNHLLAEPGDYVMFTFSDSGCGMDRETAQHIFEPFFTTKGESVGTGLGLATVYGIVRQNEGVINVYSEPGVGTTFRVYLPRCDAEAEKLSHTTQHEDIPGGDETVLVVEDEQQILDLASTLLTRYGYSVLTAGAAWEAIKLAEKHDGPIHLLLTDVVMPSMNGKELTGRIEMIKPGIKTLYMSGYTANVIAHKVVLDEGVNFIQKPFQLAALARKVRQVLDGE